MGPYFLDVLINTGDPIHHVLIAPVKSWVNAETFCGLRAIGPRCICDRCDGMRGGKGKVRKCEVCALQERKLGVVLELGD